GGWGGGRKPRRCPPCPARAAWSRRARRPRAPASELVGSRRRPGGRGLREQCRERRGAKLIARLDDRGVADATSPPTGRRQDEVEMMHDLGDAPILEKRHAEDEPPDPLGGQLAAAHRCRTGRRQGIVDPLRLDRRCELLETRRSRARADRENGLPQPHRPRLLWGRPITTDRKKDPEPG